MRELTNIREAFDTFCEQTEDLTRMTPEQQYQQLFEQMYALCEANEWGDPFSYARSREIHMAGILGHTIADDYSGADAYDQDGPCEYKSTIGKKLTATYNGISVQDTWEKQVEYIQEEKIGKYANHYLSLIHISEPTRPY